MPDRDHPHYGRQNHGRSADKVGGGKGLFTKEIEEALLEKRIDLAVHSMKDLPTELPKKLTIAGIPQRADPLDAIVGGKLRELKFGATVGTGSLRRIANSTGSGRISTSFPSGAMSTRASTKWKSGEYDAIVLAAAGLRRLGWGDIISEVFRADIMCPAVGQGALAIETLEEGAGLGSMRAAGRSMDTSACNRRARHAGRTRRRMPGAYRRVRERSRTRNCF